MPENKNDKIEAQKSDDEEFTLESRPSIDLTPENAVFTLSPGGLVSMTLKNGEEEEFFERVMLLRAFPITNPQEFVSVRVPPKIKTEKPKEIGMIRRLSDFDEKTNEVLRLTRENIEDFITEDQAKILFDTAKNADWKNKEPETTANNNAAETT